MGFVSQLLCETSSRVCRQRALEPGGWLLVLQEFSHHGELSEVAATPDTHQQVKSKTESLAMTQGPIERLRHQGRYVAASLHHT